MKALAPQAGDVKAQTGGSPAPTSARPPLAHRDSGHPSATHLSGDAHPRARCARRARLSNGVETSARLPNARLSARPSPPWPRTILTYLQPSLRSSPDPAAHTLPPSIIGRSDDATLPVHLPPPISAPRRERAALPAHRVALTHPAACTLLPAPCCLHHMALMHPAACTLLPAPCCIHPAAYTLLHAPCCLHPAACTAWR